MPAVCPDATRSHNHGATSSAALRAGCSEARPNSDKHRMESRHTCICMKKALSICILTTSNLQHLSNRYRNFYFRTMPILCQECWILDTAYDHFMVLNNKTKMQGNTYTSPLPESLAGRLTTTSSTSGPEMKLKTSIVHTQNDASPMHNIVIMQIEM